MSLIVELLDLLCLLLVVDAVLSWVVRSPQDFPRNYTTQLTEPLYAPLRKALDPQKTGGLDLSPLIWIFGLQFVASFLSKL